MLHLEDVLRGHVRVPGGETMNIAMMAGGRAFRMEIIIQEGMECGFAGMSMSTVDSAMEYSQMIASSTSNRTYSWCFAGGGYGRHMRSKTRALHRLLLAGTSGPDLSWCRRTMSDGVER